MEVVEGNVVDVLRRQAEAPQLRLERLELAGREIAEPRTNRLDEAGKEGRCLGGLDVGRVEEEVLQRAAREKLHEHAAVGQQQQRRGRERGRPEGVAGGVGERRE